MITIDYELITLMVLWSWLILAFGIRYGMEHQRCKGVRAMTPIVPNYRQVY